MRFRTLCFGALALTATVATTVVPAPAGASSGNRSILEIVDSSARNNHGDSLTDRNWQDLDILRAAVLNLPGLADAVAGLDGATVFAPTDRSFRVLVADLTGQRLHGLSEREVLQTLLDVAAIEDLNGSGVDGATALVQTVLYHVSPEEVAPLRTRTAPIPTANSVGATEITPNRVAGRVVVLADGDADDRNPIWTGRGRDASNGKVYVIDGVLRPLDLKALFPAD